MGKPLVVFAPGLGLDELEWQRVRSRLEGPSVVVTLPSLGQPAARGTDLQVEAQAARLVQRLPPGGPLVLVGHSASCPVIAHAASLTPRVVGLVLVGPVTDPAAATWPALVVQWARTAVHEPWWQLPELFRQWRRTGLGSMYRGMDAIRSFRTDVALEAAGVPVVIVRGGRDRIAAKRWSTTLSHASDGHLSTIRTAAHMVPVTHPEAVTAAVDRIVAAL